MDETLGKSTDVSRPSYYRRPPVVERVISVHVDMTSETFESRFDDWQEVVKREFPVYEPLKEWLILVREEKDGVPIFDTMQPELRITPRFSRKKSKEGFDWSLRCPIGQFTMNMHSRPEQGSERRYSHFHSEFEKWLPLWMTHFSVTSTRRISMHYVNALNSQTVPNFSTSSGLLLDKILKIFTHIPGDHEAMIPPLNCKATVKLRGRDDAGMQIKVSDWSTPQTGPGVRVDLVVDVNTPPERATNSQEVFTLLDWCHERILDRFEVIFTNEAKASFEPVK